MERRNKNPIFKNRSSPRKLTENKRGRGGKPRYGESQEKHRFLIEIPAMYLVNTQKKKKAYSEPEHILEKRGNKKPRPPQPFLV